MRRRLLLISTLVAMVMTLPGGAGLAQVDGNSYTSPTYGYRLTWDSSWWVISEETTSSGDVVGITNGAAALVLAGAPAMVSNPQACVAFARADVQRDPSFSNVARMVDTNLEPIEAFTEERAFIGLSATMTGNGGSRDVFVYLECRPIPGSQAMLNVLGFSPLNDYPAQLPQFQQIVDSIEFAPPGEDGPVMVDGAWRVHAAWATRASEFDALGLAPREDRQWVVLALNVTNWSSTDATFVPASATVMTQGDPPVRPAPKSSGIVAGALGVEAISIRDGAMFTAGESRRVVLAYQVPVSQGSLYLLIGDQRMPLGSAFNTRDLNQDTLPALSTPPRLERVSVLRVTDGSHLVVTGGSGQPREITLLSVDAPAGSDCFAGDAAARLTKLAGDSVWLERDSAWGFDAGEPMYWVWRERPNGMRKLINQELVAGGYAASQLTGTRFRYWISESQLLARDANAGLWGACTGPHGDPLIAGGTTTPASTANDADATAVTIDMVDLAFEPRNLVIPANTNVTITVVNKGAAQHQFEVEGQDVDSGLVNPGAKVDLRVNLSPGHYMFRCPIPGHTEAGQVGELDVRNTGPAATSTASPSSAVMPARSAETQRETSPSSSNTAARESVDLDGGWSGGGLDHLVLEVAGGWVTSMTVNLIDSNRSPNAATASSRAPIEQAKLVFTMETSGRSTPAVSSALDERGQLGVRITPSPGGYDANLFWFLHRL